MGSSSESDLEGYDFTWVIKNPSLSFLNPGELIYSSEFFTNFLSTEWMFFLRPWTSQGNLSIYLQRNFDSGPESVRVYVKDLKLLRLIDYNLIAERGTLEFTYEKGDAFQIFKIPYYHEELIKITLNPASDKLRISCRLQPDSTVFDGEALTELSQDMTTLFMNPEFCDTTLCANEREFRIHRAIFEARASGLRLQGKCKHEDETLRIPIRNIEAAALYEFLYFMYSAQLDPDTELGDYNLKDTATQMGIPNFESKFFLGTSEWNASTSLKCKRKCIRLNIDRAKKDNVHARTFYVGDVEWCFRSHFSNSSTEENVSVHFSPTKVVTGADLNIRFVLAMQSYCGTDLASKIAYGSIKRTDSSRKSLKLNLKFEKGDDDSVTTISLVRFLIVSIEIWSGKANAVPKAKHNHPITTTDILALSRDLLQLFESQSRADVTIIVPDGKFRVHKAILCARSPVFSRMFNTDMKEKANSEVAIADFGKRIIAKLLKFIYCAQVIFDDTEEVIQLAYAADKYALMILRKKCLRYLRNQYDKKFMLDIYAAFDFLQCDDLKEGFEEYIRYIFRRRSHKELEDFKQKWPYLYGKIFRKNLVSKSSAGIQQ